MKINLLNTLLAVSFTLGTSALSLATDTLKEENETETKTPTILVTPQKGESSLEEVKAPEIVQTLDVDSFFEDQGSEKGLDVKEEKMSPAESSDDESSGTEKKKGKRSSSDRKEETEEPARDPNSPHKRRLKEFFTNLEEGKEMTFESSTGLALLYKKEAGKVFLQTDEGWEEDSQG